jgi:hypothetical protein
MENHDAAPSASENSLRRVIWPVRLTVRICTYREVLVVQYASVPLMNIAVATYPRLYVRPMEKHELELVTSTCTISCNVLLQDCTRHNSDVGFLFVSDDGNATELSILLLWLMIYLLVTSLALENNITKGVSRCVQSSKHGGGLGHKVVKNIPRVACQWYWAVPIMKAIISPWIMNTAIRYIAFERYPVTTQQYMSITTCTTIPKKMGS